MRISRLGKTGLAVTGVVDGTSGAAFVSRYFAPGAGISEDPVTGSTHATLAPYWSGILGASRGWAFQASTRGGWLDFELVKDRVFLRGAAKTFMEATIFLPDLCLDAAHMSAGPARQPEAAEFWSRPPKRRCDFTAACRTRHPGQVQCNGRS